MHIKEKVVAAINLLIKNDSFLLTNGVNERSISHKLGEYLQLYFQDMHVDCEYNREHDRTKQLPYTLSSEPINTTKARTVYPDIIIHHRNTHDNNLLVIEIKKQENCDNDDEARDIEKINDFLNKPYSYQHGLFINFAEDLTYTMKWFERNIGNDA